MFNNVVVGVEDCADGRHALELASARVFVEGRITLVYVEAAFTSPPVGEPDSLCRPSATS